MFGSRTDGRRPTFSSSRSFVKRDRTPRCRPVPLRGGDGDLMDRGHDENPGDLLRRGRRIGRVRRSAVEERIAVRRNSRVYDAIEGSDARSGRSASHCRVRTPHPLSGGPRLLRELVTLCSSPRYGSSLAIGSDPLEARDRLARRRRRQRGVGLLIQLGAVIVGKRSPAVSRARPQFFDAGTRATGPMSPDDEGGGSAG